VAMEEAQEAPDVVIGMFLINDTSAVVMFDSGASHSFIDDILVYSRSEEEHEEHLRLALKKL
jgi:hypothetical protein